MEFVNDVKQIVALIAAIIFLLITAYITIKKKAPVILYYTNPR
jgi:hypothetical protein